MNVKILRTTFLMNAQVAHGMYKRQNNRVLFKDVLYVIHFPKQSFIESSADVY